MKKNVILDLAVGVLIICVLLFVNIPYLKIAISGLIVLIYTGLSGGLKDRLGFHKPKSWMKVWLLGICFGLLAVTMTYFVLIPIITKLASDALLLNRFKQIQGNSTILYTSLAVGWVIGGFFEEVIFRGFLLGRILEIRDSILIKIGGVIFTSILFGYLHSYQGLTGQIVTALIGAFLGLLFIWNKRSIWLNIITHGMINTISMLCIYTGLIEV